MRNRREGGWWERGGEEGEETGWRVERREGRVGRGESVGERGVEERREDREDS